MLEISCSFTLKSLPRVKLFFFFYPFFYRSSLFLFSIVSHLLLGILTYHCLWFKLIFSGYLPFIIFYVILLCVYIIIHTYSYMYIPRAQHAKLHCPPTHHPLALTPEPLHPKLQCAWPCHHTLRLVLPLLGTSLLLPCLQSNWTAPTHHGGEENMEAPACCAALLPLGSLSVRGG